MAVPSYTTDLLTYNDCTDATGWLELIGMALSAPPDIDTDLAIHGGICITSDRAKTGLSSNAYVGAGITLVAGECIFLWHKFFAPNSLGLLSEGGVRVMIGDSSSVYDGWYMDGSDTYGYGGWVNYVVDPTTTPDQVAGTTTGTYAMVGNGWNLPTQAPAKGNPFGTDIIRYGRGESIFTGGETADYATFDGYALVNDHPTTGRFGLIQDQGGSYLYKGLMSLGTTATLVDMRDANVVINIDDTTKVDLTFNRIEVNNASSNIEWTAVLITALGIVSKGQFEAVDNATISKTSCAFTDMGTFIYQSNSTLTSTTYRRCGNITQGGATFTGCIFDTPVGVLSVSNLNLITESTFTSDGTGHGVDLGIIASTQSINWNNNDSGYTNTSSGDETILASVDTGITLTINVGSGYSTPSVYNTGLGTVNVVSGQVTLTIEVVDINTGLPIADLARVYVLTDAGGSLAEDVVIIDAELTDGVGIVTDTRSYSTSQPVKGRVRKASETPFYKTAPIAGTIDNASGLSLTIQMIPDE